MSDHLALLEAESIHIMREVFYQFEKPVLLYSVGKDSSVLLRLLQKAFLSDTPPIPLMHVDTGYKFPEMYKFRDEVVEQIGARLITYRNEQAIAEGSHPAKYGTEKCCGLLKTKALLDGLNLHGFDAAIGGARRDEEKSRAKERIFSFRDSFGQWNPRAQRPEIWNIFNGRIRKGETIRVFPLSNWTELDIWLYIKRENIPIAPLYYAEKRAVIKKGNSLFPVAADYPDQKSVVYELCRFRSLGCMPCTGAVASNASSIDDIIAELKVVRTSERSLRVIDHDSDASMEKKKREGYF